MTYRRIVATWAALAVLMSANGVFRETVLKSAFSGEAANMLSAALGITIILLVTSIAFRPLAGESSRRLAMASAMLVVLTVIFEFSIGLTVDRKSWSELAANYAFWRGELWPFVLLIVALTPFIWGRWYARTRTA